MVQRATKFAMATMACALAAFSHSAHAQTFTGTYTDTGNGNVNTASASFSLVVGTTSYLRVTLTNTSSFTGGYNNPDALSGLFFDIASNPALDMTQSSAISPLALINPSTCATSYATTCGSPDVPLGAEWLYEYSATGFTATTFNGSAARYGVAASQYSSLTPSFGKGNTTQIGLSQPALAANGTGQLAFSLVGSNYNSALAANSLQGLPLANTSLTFQFALPAGVSSLSLRNVYFTYGTAPDSSSGGVLAPEPATIAVFGLGLGALGVARRRLGAASSVG